MIKILASVAFLASSCLASLIVAPTAGDYGTIDAVKTDLSDLDHFKAYYWRLNLNDDFATAGFGLGDVSKVTLKINNIYNYDISDVNNVLYMDILDQKPTSTTQDFVVVLDDNTPGNVDYFKNPIANLTGYSSSFSGTSNSYTGYTASSRIAQWTDTDGSKTKSMLSYDVNLTTFKNYVGSDGIVSFGFDGDCHFFNDGVSLEIETNNNVPEPTMLALLGCGLLGLVFVRRKK